MFAQLYVLDGLVIGHGVAICDSRERRINKCLNFARARIWGLQILVAAEVESREKSFVERTEEGAIEEKCYGCSDGMDCDSQVAMFVD